MRRILEEGGFRVRRTDSAFHCVVMTALTPQEEIPSRGLEGWRNVYAVSVMNREVKVVDFPGVFSEGELDPGSRMLLETLDEREFLEVLDLGSGAGILGSALRLAWPKSTVHMVDCDSLAVEAGRRTLAANGLNEDGVWASDVFSDVPKSYDLIISNPSFHAGADASLKMAGSFLKGCRVHLKRGGRIRIVANRFLRYAPLIKRELGGFKVLREDGKYRVYEAFRVG
jgi:16S rRNA (guanine1207-N2)-methyltransferase